MSCYQSENLLYRPITLDDTDVVVKWRNSEHVKRNFIYRKNISREDHLTWFNDKIILGHVIQFVVVEKATGTPIGSVYFRDVDKVARKAEYGVFIGEEDYVGRGYGSEIAKAMVEYFFTELEFHKLSLRVLEKNKPAIRSYEKAGFKIEGIMKDEEYIDGQYETVIYMAILEEDR